MKCVNCLYNKTQVINSRARSDGLSVWRRRKCPQCGHVATSEETTSISGAYSVISSRGTERFEVIRLVLSIVDALQAAGIDTEAALPLAQTVQEHIIRRFRPAEPLQASSIAATALPVIKHYHPLAGTIYAAKHHIDEPKRGRPKAI